MNHLHQYKNLGIMAVLSFVSMYILMYAMVDSFSNVFGNYNQFYMAGLMTSPMILIELIVMRMMYPNKMLNLWIMGISLVVLIFFWTGIRQQFAINDEQFLKSMIPHHAGAILMCNEAKLEDVEIKELCNNILSGQQTEIDFMKGKLDKLNR